MSPAYQDQEAERQRAVDAERAQAREVERMAALEVVRGRFVEETAQAWQDSREISDGDDAKQRQKQIVSQVEKAAARFECGFEEIAGPVNARADEIRDERALELEKKYERDC